MRSAVLAVRGGGRSESAQCAWTFMLGILRKPSSFVTIVSYPDANAIPATRMSRTPGVRPRALNPEKEFGGADRSRAVERQDIEPLEQLLDLGEPFPVDAPLLVRPHEELEGVDLRRRGSFPAVLQVLR